MEDLTVDPTKIELDERKKKRRERELSDIRKILQLPEGRRFYWRVIEEGAVFNDAFAGSGYADQTMYNLGSQSVSRRFLNDLLFAKPEALQQMQQERQAEDKDDKLQEDIIRRRNGGLV
jgi:hypothetical protein